MTFDKRILSRDRQRILALASRPLPLRASPPPPTRSCAISFGGSLHFGGPRGASWSAAGQVLRLPGSWVPLALMLGIFRLKFGVGASLGLEPGLRGNAGFTAAASLAYGVGSGGFAGRALGLWPLARPLPQVCTA